MRVHDDPPFWCRRSGYPCICGLVEFQSHFSTQPHSFRVGVFEHGLDVGPKSLPALAFVLRQVGQWIGLAHAGEVWGGRDYSFRSTFMLSQVVPENLDQSPESCETRGCVSSPASQSGCRRGRPSRAARRRGRTLASGGPDGDHFPRGIEHAETNPCARRSDDTDARFGQNAQGAENGHRELAHVRQPWTTVVNSGEGHAHRLKRRRVSGPRRSSVERDAEGSGFVHLAWEETKEGETVHGAYVAIITGAGFPTGVGLQSAR
jgi:hypothetical protein